MFEEARKVHHRTDSGRAPGNRDEYTCEPECGHLAEQDVARAVYDVQDRDGTFVLDKLQALAQRVADRAADQQPDAGSAPDEANAHWAGMEDFFREETKQNLGGPAAGCPPNVDEHNAGDERSRADVTEAFAVFLEATQLTFDKSACGA